MMAETIGTVRKSEAMASLNYVWGWVDAKALITSPDDDKLKASIKNVEEYISNQ
jgi:hypothetical protein